MDDGEFRDLLIRTSQRVDDILQRVNAHVSYITMLTGGLGGAVGLVFLILYEFVLPPLLDRIRHLEEQQVAQDGQLVELQKALARDRAEHELLDRQHHSLDEMINRMQKKEGSRP